MESQAYQVARNPNDVATVVSILPYDIRETKPGLVPSEFFVPKGDEDVPGLLVVEGSYHQVYLDDSRPRLTVPVPSVELAASICRDHKTSMFGFVTDEAEPGLFYVPGRYTKADIQRLKGEHRVAFERAKRTQLAWFQRLIEYADDQWARHGEHKLITDVMRLAAEATKLERPWLSKQVIEKALSLCPACMSVVNPKAVICSSCRFILKPEEHKKMQFATVE